MSTAIKACSKWLSIPICCGIALACIQQVLAGKKCICCIKKTWYCHSVFDPVKGVLCITCAYWVSSTFMPFWRSVSRPWFMAALALRRDIGAACRQVTQLHSQTKKLLLVGLGLDKMCKWQIRFSIDINTRRWYWRCYHGQYAKKSANMLLFVIFSGLQQAVSRQIYWTWRTAELGWFASLHALVGFAFASKNKQTWVQTWVASTGLGLYIMIP